MRLRNIPGARDVMEENKFVFTEPEGMKGTWGQVFGNENPIHIEIGMGKGKFIVEMAKKNPQINFVGIEKYSSVLQFKPKQIVNFKVIILCKGRTWDPS